MKKFFSIVIYSIFIILTFGSFISSISAAPIDSDLDGVFDRDDFDDDNDGIPDVYECTSVWSGLVGGNYADTNFDDTQFLEIRPSDFSISASSTAQTVTRDYSSMYGLSTGSILISLSDAHRLSTQDRFYIREDLNPTKVEISGSFQVAVQVEQGLEYTGNTGTRSKTINFLDIGSSYIEDNGSSANGSGITVSQSGSLYTISNTTTTNASLSKRVNVNGTKTIELGISDTDVGTNVETTFYLRFKPICDTDGDGIPNQFDLDTDNDGCHDSIEGDGGTIANQDVKPYFVPAVYPINVGTGSIEDNVNLCGDASCVSDATYYYQGVFFNPNFSQAPDLGSPNVANYWFQLVGNSQNPTKVTPNTPFSDITAEVGQTVTFSSSGGYAQTTSTFNTDGTPDYSASPQVAINGYQWQISTNSGSAFTDIPGETLSSLTLTGITSDMHKNIYRLTAECPDVQGCYIFVDEAQLLFKFDLAYDANTGTGTMSTESHTGSSDVILTANTFTKTGYVFGTWNTQVDGTGSGYTNTGSFTMPVMDTILYAQWLPATDTAYTVEHYQEQTDESFSIVSADTESLIGTTDSTVTATAKNYTNYSEDTTNTNRVSTGSITPDGSLKLKLYYKLNRYEIDFEENGGSSVASVTGVIHGTATSAPSEPTKIGYVFDGWYIDNGTFANSYDFSSLVTGDFTLYSKWAPAIDIQYTVEHYQEQLNGTFLLVSGDTESLTGTTDSTVTATAKSYTNYSEDTSNTHRVATGSIAPDGSLKLKLYYVLDTYTVTFDIDGDTTTEPNQNVKHGGNATNSTSIPTKIGYTFAGFKTSCDISGTSPESTVITSDTTFYACWTPNGDTLFTIEYYLQNSDQSYPGSANQNESSSGTTDALADAGEKSFTGYLYDSGNTGNIQSGMILANGSLILKRYYRTNTPPTLTATGVTITQGQSLNLLSLANAIDAEDGDISSNIAISNNDGFDSNTPGTYTITYSVTDNDGNTTTTTASIEVRALPVLTATGTSITEGGSLDLLSLASANDREDGDISSNITISDDGGFDPNTPGTYTIRFQVTDSDGNSVIKESSVTVKRRGSSGGVKYDRCNGNDTSGSIYDEKCKKEEEVEEKTPEDKEQEQETDTPKQENTVKESEENPEQKETNNHQETQDILQKVAPNGQSYTLGNDFASCPIIDYINDDNYQYQKSGVFTDEDIAKFREEILKFAEIGIVDGYDDNHFKPEKLMTRAEFLKVALISHCYKYRYLEGDTPYSDMIQNTWQARVVEKSEELGMIHGDTLSINQSINKNLYTGINNEDVKELKRVLSSLGLYDGNIDIYFSSDLEEAIGAFQLSQKLVNSRLNIGFGVWGPQTRKRFFEMYPETEYSVFRPNTKITKAEAVKMLMRISLIYANKPLKLQYKDIEVNWHEQYIQTGETLGLFFAEQDEYTFKPNSYVQRQDMVDLINRLVRFYR